jgi:SAM-dependent methyltransferase
MAKEISAAEAREHWEANADAWSAEVRSGHDLYREKFNNPAFLRFVGDLRGRCVLDVGCGEGYNTRIWARAGARMTGIDIAPRMIALAREAEANEALGIRYEVASFLDLAMFGESSFEAAVSTMALMDGPEFPRAMAEIRRVLRQGGALSFSILHPCFMTKGFDWLRDAEQRENGLRVAEYFFEESWIDRWMFSAARRGSEQFAIPRYGRTLSYYLNNVIKAGMAIDAVEEPRPSREAVGQFPGLGKWREHAALVFYLKAHRV